MKDKQRSGFDSRDFPTLMKELRVTTITPGCTSAGERRRTTTKCNSYNNTNSTTTITSNINNRTTTTKRTSQTMRRPPMFLTSSTFTTPPTGAHPTSTPTRRWSSWTTCLTRTPNVIRVFHTFRAIIDSSTFLQQTKRTRTKPFAVYFNLHCYERRNNQSKIHFSSSSLSIVVIFINKCNILPYLYFLALN